jgi:hypothetical protein
MQLLSERGWKDAIPDVVSTPSIMDRLRTGVQSIFGRNNQNNQVNRISEATANAARHREGTKRFYSGQANMQGFINAGHAAAADLGRAYETSAFNPPRGGLDLSHFNVNSRASSSLPVTNRSGLAKEQILANNALANKDVVSKMTPEEFSSTVFKPSGEVVPYQTMYDPLPGVYGMNSSQYADRFNENLDLLNDIITRHNKSGVDYKVAKLSPDGTLSFHTPAQGDIPRGFTTWHTKIIPGEFRGEIQDIPNADYYKSIPGLNMSSSSQGVFSDSVRRRGSGAYEAINEYLKSMDLGRVKPGFNSQSNYSRPLWENAVKKGKAFGYYNDPGTVYGAMKTVAPVIGAGAVASEFMDEKENGGWLDKYNDGGPIQPNYNDASVSMSADFVGDGYDTTGRNYSPAWGGQFEDGGAIPQFQPGGKVKSIIVNDKNDPRLKSYNDSLSSWKSGHSFDKLKSLYTGAIKNSYDLITDPKKISKIKSIDSKVQPTAGLFFNTNKFTNSYLSDKPTNHFNPDLEKAKANNWKKAKDDSYYNNEGAMVVADLYSFKKPTQPVEYQERTYQTETPQLQPLPIQGMDANLPELQRVEGPSKWMRSFGNGADQNYWSKVDAYGMPLPGYTAPNQHAVVQPAGPGEDFAMGGSLPGATGHFYARYSSGGSAPGDVDYNAPRNINPAPSKGPYGKKTVASAQNGAEMAFYQNGLDWKPKSISKDGSEIIKDDMGQWTHPGKVTQIGSNQITMQGVPYPVLGISDTGDVQMMYPNQEYNYDGSSVTEYPMMKEGGALQLVKLDQLTNFTNYNTKQPGQNWLDKYQ